MWDILLVALGGLLITAVIVNWDTVVDWFSQNRTIDSTHGSILIEALNSGNYNLVAGVFDSQNRLTASHKWQEIQLDQTILNKFSNSDKIVFSLTD